MADWWFSLGTKVSFTNITEIWLKVVLNASQNDISDHISKDNSEKCIYMYNREVAINNSKRHCL